MLKRILLWLAIVFAVFYILTPPAMRPMRCRGLRGAGRGRGRAFLTFIDALLSRNNRHVALGEPSGPPPPGEQYLLPGRRRSSTGQTDRSAVDRWFLGDRALIAAGALTARRRSQPVTTYIWLIAAFPALKPG